MPNVRYVWILRSEIKLNVPSRKKVKAENRSRERDEEASYFWSCMPCDGPIQKDCYNIN